MEPPQRSTEYGGVGQSGYAAGRHDHDHALDRELLVRPVAHRRGIELDAQDPATDDRFTGRGGSPED